MTSARNVTRISGLAQILTLRLRSRSEDKGALLKIPIYSVPLLMLDPPLGWVNLRLRFFFAEFLGRRGRWLANAIEKCGVGLLLPLHRFGL